MYEEFLEYTAKKEYDGALRLFRENPNLPLSWGDYLELRTNLPHEQAEILDRCFWFGQH